jgi:transposase InsO family protein
LLTDHGRNFTPAIFRETCKILSIKQLFTTAQQPQLKGYLEKWHRTFCDGIELCQRERKYLGHAGIIRFNVLQKHVVWGSKHVPFYMLHGREMVLPSL